MRKWNIANIGEIANRSAKPNKSWDMGLQYETGFL